jgi:tetratricopeptide (TPR) repeat protein
MDLIAASSPAALEIKNLVTASFAARYDDLTASLVASRSAVALVEKTQEELPADLVVAAWTQYGNALRLTGRYVEAGEALATAGERQLSELPTPTSAHLLSVRASLHLNTGRFANAANCLVAAIAVHRSLGDTIGEARLHSLLGIVYKDWGKLPEAFDSFQKAMDLLGPDSPPELVVATGHNMFAALIKAGRLEDAAAALALLEPQYRRLASPRILAKAEWMRARLCRAMRQLSAARLAYERAYDILIAEPASPDLLELADEMADLFIPMKPGD